MMRTILSLLLCLFSAPLAIAEALDFIGNWKLNPERTEELRAETDTASPLDGLGGSVRTGVSVGGVYVPVGVPGADVPVGDPGNPKMLRCQAFTIERQGDALLLTYEGVGSELFRPGAYRGTRSQWSRRKLTSNYESSTRKVKRTLEVDRNGRLVMSVVINPKRGKTKRFKRVFDRA